MRLAAAADHTGDRAANVRCHVITVRRGADSRSRLLLLEQSELFKEHAVDLVFTIQRCAERVRFESIDPLVFLELGFPRRALYHLRERGSPILNDRRWH